MSLALGREGVKDGISQKTRFFSDIGTDGKIGMRYHEKSLLRLCAELIGL